MTTTWRSSSMMTEAGDRLDISAADGCRVTLACVCRLLSDDGTAMIKVRTGPLKMTADEARQLSRLLQRAVEVVGP